MSSYLDRPVQSYAWRNANSLAAVIDERGDRADRHASAIPSRRRRRDRMTGRLVSGGAQLGALARARGEVDGLRPSHRRQAGRGLPLGRGQAEAAGPDLAQRPAGLRARPARRSRASRSPAPTATRSTAGCSGRRASTRTRSIPFVFLIHGGPQGAWHDEWHGRWNYQMFAVAGIRRRRDQSPRARPATARSSPTRSARTGPARSTKTS